MNNDHESPGELARTDSYDLTRIPTTDSGPDPTRPPTDKQSSTQWKPSSRTVDETLAEGLSNEDLWMLIRRFNKVRRRALSNWHMVTMSVFGSWDVTLAEANM